MNDHRRTTLKLVLALALAFSASAVAMPAQQSGEIRGTVTDEDGHAVTRAKVNVQTLDGRPQASLLRYVETDSDGHFSISGLKFGRYGVFAMKEEALYPNMSSSFYSNNVFPSATITARVPVAEVQIRLGPKAARLTGTITNGINGAPIDGSLKLTRAAAPNEWLSTSVPTEYRILLPSSTDIVIEASAPGFKTWSPARPVRVRPGAELRLDVALDPSSDPNLHPSKFLVPSGFIGWLLLDYEVKDAPPVPVENSLKTFEFPASGRLATSSPGPDMGAADQFFYYSPDGSLEEIPNDYRNGGGMIWGSHQGTRDGLLRQFGFFVGTEQQFKKYRMQETRPGPLHELRPTASQ